MNCFTIDICNEAINKINTQLKILIIYIINKTCNFDITKRLFLTFKYITDYL